MASEADLLDRIDSTRDFQRAVVRDVIADLVPEFKPPPQPTGKRAVMHYAAAVDSKGRRSAARYCANQRANDLAAYRAYYALRRAEAEREAAEMDKLVRKEERAKSAASKQAQARAAAQAQAGAAEAERAAAEMGKLTKKKNDTVRREQSQRAPAAHNLPRQEHQQRQIEQEAAVLIQSQIRGREARAEARQLASARTLQHTHSVWEGEGDAEVAAVLAAAERLRGSLWEGEGDASSCEAASGDTTSASVVPGWYPVAQPANWQAVGQHRWYPVASDGAGDARHDARPVPTAPTAPTAAVAAPTISAASANARPVPTAPTAAVAAPTISAASIAAAITAALAAPTISAASVAAAVASSLATSPLSGADARSGASGSRGITRAGAGVPSGNRPTQPAVAPAAAPLHPRLTARVPTQRPGGTAISTQIRDGTADDRPRGRSSPPRSTSPRSSFGMAARWPAADASKERTGPGSYSPRSRRDGRPL
jgi:hypothetical protein